jgi:hypothetical protein
MSKKNEEGSDYPLTLRYIPDDMDPVNTIDSDEPQLAGPIARSIRCTARTLVGHWQEGHGDILQDGHLSTEPCDIRPPSNIALYPVTDNMKLSSSRKTRFCGVHSYVVCFTLPI